MKKRISAVSYEYTLGIDIGTTSISVMLYDIDRHAVVDVCSEASLAFVESAFAWQREQSCEKILMVLRRLLQRLAKTVGGPLTPKSIAVTGQMHSFVLLNENKQPISNLITWQDERCLQIAPDGRSWLQHFKNLIPAQTLRGMSPASGYMGPTVYAMTKSGQLPPETRYIVMMHDWIVSELSGRTGKPVTDYTFAQSSGLLLEQEKRWDVQLAESAGISPAWLPELASAGCLIAVASNPQYPIKSGTPIVAGLGDHQAAIFGSLNHPEDELFLNIGTGGQISAVTKKFAVIPGLETRIYLDDQWLLVGSSLCGGRAFALLKDFVRDIGERVFGKSLEDRDLYQYLISLSEKPTTLICNTCFAGSRYADNQSGSITGITPDNFHIRDFASAVLDGIVRELYDFFARMGICRKKVIGSGNGFRCNSVLQKKAAEQFGLPLSVASFEEEACLGAARIAALSATQQPAQRQSTLRTGGSPVMGE
jgi:sedoheptulokinase